MKQNLLNHVFFLSVFLWIRLLHADGFVVGTLVHAQQGLVPIEQCVEGNYIIAYDNQKICTHHPISYTKRYAVDSYIKITVDNECVCASPDQKFYVLNKSKWINAHELELSDQLLCCKDEIVFVKAIEVLNQQQEMYAISVDTNHTFCVGHYGIVVHNVEPGTTTATVIALSFTCPPAAVALAIGEVVAFGVAGFVMYYAHKKLQKNKKKLDGCFSQEEVLREVHDNTIPKVNGCFPLYVPVVELSPGCTIAVEGQTKTTEIMSYETPEGMNDGCEFPIEVVQESVVHFEDTKKDDCDDKKQYDGQQYNRTEDWIKEHSFGQKIRKSLERSKCTNQGKRAFNVIKNIENCDGFKKGDYIVVDAMHKDHLEVFGKDKGWKQVANFDGTKNKKKTEQGRMEPRRRLEG